MQKCAGETTSDITILRNEMWKKNKRHSQGFINGKAHAINSEDVVIEREIKVEKISTIEIAFSRAIVH